MFKVNEYFDGSVKSLSFQTSDGKATIGVIAAGEYKFGTTSIEYMTIISGSMEVMLENETKWQTYKEFETFVVKANSNFTMKVDSDTAYRCLYK
jgi:purine/pyrimidine-nucleoside phosphorylase